MANYQGQLSARGKRFAVVVSRFNEFITRRLLNSAVETLGQAGARSNEIDVIWAPGALEVPYFCDRLAKARRHDAIIALACVLRGDTFHFECVSNEVTRGVSQVAMKRSMPIATGIITADRLEQAIDRAGLKAGNKGGQAALAAIEIANLDRRLMRKLNPRKKLKPTSGKRRKRKSK